MLRQVADSYVVVAVGDACVDFDGMLTLNESGALLWRTLEQGADRDALTGALTAEYDVQPPQARADVEEFLASLRDAGCLDE